MDIFVRLLNAILMVAMPIGLGVFLGRRYRVGWRLFLVGAVAFIGSQIIHLPFNSWFIPLGIERLGLSQATQGFQLVLLSLLYGLTAGIFEETARFLVYRFWLKNARSWREALMIGAGHGGIESIVVGGLAAFALYQAVAYSGADVGALVPAEQLELVQAQLTAYWEAPWYGVLLGGIERAFTLCFHLGASILVLQAFTRKNVVWLAVAVGWHTLVDGLALFALNTWGIYATEALLGLVAVFSIWIVFTLRTPENDVGDAPPRVLPDLKLQEVDLTNEELDEERVDDSRYV
jgi:uncharacterized membrane protein YhfC